MAFFTIHRRAGLGPAQRRRASGSGPPAVAAARPYPQLLAAAGFTEVTETDCTTEFAATTEAWLQQWDANHAALAALLGEQQIADRQAARRAQLRGIREGLLARSLYTARRPAGRTGNGSRRSPAE